MRNIEIADPIDLLRLAECNGIGRNVLEERLRVAAVEMAILRRDNAQLLDNLTAVQKRCTELLEETRALKLAAKHSPFAVPQ